MRILMAVDHGMAGDCQRFNHLIATTSPYLFPFVLEYSLIAMGTLAVMYSAVDEATDEQANTLRRIQNLFRVPALSANDGTVPIGLHCSVCRTHRRGVCLNVAYVCTRGSLGLIIHITVCLSLDAYAKLYAVDEELEA